MKLLKGILTFFKSARELKEENKEIYEERYKDEYEYLYTQNPEL